MPTYDYNCQTCGEDFELFQSFSEDALTKCPTKKSGDSPAGCKSSGRGRVTKVFSPPGISFKGSGFYKNDSRVSSTSGSSSAKSSSESSSSKSEGSSDSSSAKSDSAKSTKSNDKSTTSAGSSSSD
ncbi:MAG: FmdB family zinc ribbon protein [Acidimicrobiales bacterium]